MTDTITPKLANAASIAGRTPGRTRISRNGAAGARSSSCAPIISAICFGSGRTNSTSTSATRLIPPAASHGTVSADASRWRPANSGPKAAGPRIAPKTDPNSTYEIPRARRSGGYMSPAAVRISSATPLAAPVSMNPRMRMGGESMLVASAVRQQPAVAAKYPQAITGRLPKRSIARPAGTAVSADATRKIAGPRPSSPRAPVTSTNVIEDTAAVSCRTAEYTAIAAARISVLRVTFTRPSVAGDVDIAGAEGLGLMGVLVVGVAPHAA